MKKYVTIGIIFILIMSGNACKKESTTTPTTNPSTIATNPIIGTWQISSFIKGKVDCTNNFIGYTFTCNSNGGMTILGNGHNYNNCSWNNDNGDSTMCHLHIMGCDNNSTLWDCNDDWDMINQDTNHCYFSAVNPNHPYLMTWTKN